ncbi:hypothetical protein K435DRAFT_811935 [Dendrothele bispora CBS 962.96]|uniref:Uncharacterized protein n=1 Tax=Dendrothele bispora (strain CBS 962.96) TaxID=1314807 RepID=A0A4V4HB55_DENBC|nr:hypothetical protein K435DRAFT_811935 [Dendrothele bispora CBS 962.96]
MWDILDPAKNYIRLLIWIDFLIPLEDWGNLTKDSKVKDHAGTLSLSSYKSGKKLTVERVNEFVESAYNKISAVVFKMVLKSTQEVCLSVNTARKLQEALIARGLSFESFNKMANFTLKKNRPLLALASIWTKPYRSLGQTCFHIIGGCK